MDTYTLATIDSSYKEVEDFFDYSLQHWDRKKKTFEKLISLIHNENKKTYNELLSCFTCQDEIDYIKRVFYETDSRLNKQISEIYLNNEHWKDHKEKSIFYYLE